MSALDRVRLRVLLFGLVGAPPLWLAQLILSYAISAVACYGGDHPTTIASGGSLRTALFAFDAVALSLSLAAVIVACASWRAVRVQQQSGPEGRTRFVALWGVMSSLCFFSAIVFHTLASVMAPLCVR